MNVHFLSGLVVLGVGYVGKTETMASRSAGLCQRAAARRGPATSPRSANN